MSPSTSFAGVFPVFAIWMEAAMDEPSEGKLLGTITLTPGTLINSQRIPHQSGETRCVRSCSKDGDEEGRSPSGA